MKVKIDQDDWYVIMLTDNLHEWGSCVEVPDELWKRYKRVSAQYEKLQEDLVEYIDNVDKYRTKAP